MPVLAIIMAVESASVDRPTLTKARYHACGLVVILATLLRGLHAEAATGSPSDAATDWYEKGLALSTQNESEQALAAFQRAHRLAPSERTFGQMGLAEAELGRWVESEVHLTAALQSDSTDWLAKWRKTLERELGYVRRHVGSLLVIGTVGAQVSVDGQIVGTLPLTKMLRVGEGMRRVVARADGYDELVESVTVSGGGSATAEMVLKSLARNTADPLLTGADPVPAPPETWRPLQIAFWSTAAGAAVAAGVAIYETALWSSRTSAFQAHEGSLPGGRRGPDCAELDAGRGGAGCQALYDRLTSARTASVAAYVVTGVLVASSAVLFLVTPPPARIDERAAAPILSFRCGPGATPLGLFCQGSF